MSAFPWFVVGITIGATFGLELARRAYKDTASLLGRSCEILREMDDVYRPLMEAMIAAKGPE